MTLVEIALLLIAIGVCLPKTVSLFTIENELKEINRHLGKIAYELERSNGGPHYE